MPANPLHAGLGVLLCRLAGGRGCGAALAGSLLVDLEPGAVMLLGLEARLHGPLHTLAAALALGWLAGLAGRALWLRLGLPGGLAAPSWRLAGLLGAAGWAGHVALDSPLYTDITPLQPLTAWNPLYNVAGGATLPLVYAASAALTLWGAAWLAAGLRGARRAAPRQG